MFAFQKLLEAQLLKVFAGPAYFGIVFLSYDYLKTKKQTVFSS